MTPWKMGPHDQDGRDYGKSWARSANEVNACGNPAVLHEAPDHALRIWRWPFSQAEQTRLLDTMDVDLAAGMILSPLNGYNHRNLWVESLNEIPRQDFARLVEFLRRLGPVLANRGYKLTGPASATGDYESGEVDQLRTLNLGLWTFHGYMTRAKGPTEWNAYRMRQFWRPGDPGVVYSEAGYDRCKDGPITVNEGYLPLGPGPYGWYYQFNGDKEAAEQGMIGYARGLDRPWELGAVAFTTSPKPNWAADGYDMDPLVPAMIREYAPWSPTMPGRLNDWCPFAEVDVLPPGCWDPTRDNNLLPYMICDHITDGAGDPGSWWRQLLNGPVDKRTSAHFWVAKDGRVKQYVPISGQAWSNGPVCQPDRSNTLIDQIVRLNRNPNAATISIEHEGRPGDIFLEPQIQASQKLHAWIHANHAINLNRTSVVGHYQFDLCTRARCPGPAFPWGRVLLGGNIPVPEPTPPTFDRAKEWELLWKKAEEWEKAGYPWMGQGIKSLVAKDKGEK